MSRFADRALPLTLLALMVGASLAALPSQAYPVTPAQQTLVNQKFSDQAPFMPWQAHTEMNRFHLESPPTSTSTGAQDLPFVLGNDAVVSNLTTIPRDTELTANPINGAPVTQADAMAAPDPLDKQVFISIPASSETDGVANVATFTMTPESIPVDQVTLYRAGASVWAACDLANDDPLLLYTGDRVADPLLFGPVSFAGIHSVLTLEHFDGKVWTPQTVLSDQILEAVGADPIIGVYQHPEQIQFFTSDPSTFGDATRGDGVVVDPKVSRIVAQFSIAESVAYQAIGDGQSGSVIPGSSCVIHYDSTQFDSQAFVLDNGARASIFTHAEGVEHTLGFSSGSSTDAARRRVVVQVEQANPWGNGGEAARRESSFGGVRIYDMDDNVYRYYVDNFDDANALERNIHDSIDLVSRTDLLLSPTMVERTFTFAYNTTLADGPLQPQYYVRHDSGTFSSLNRWDMNAPTIQVGGKGFTFSLVSTDNAKHLVNPKEPTEFVFQVVNIGTEDDVITVAPTEPGSGWTASMAGGSAFVRPGGKSLLTLLVTPPANAVAGASQGVTVRASSSFNDVPDATPVTVTVQLVSQVTHLVDLTLDRAALEVRPGQPKTFTATVTNKGTSRDHFVLVGNLPTSGWSVATNPSTLQVLAGSSAPVLVTVTPPAEAGSNTATALTLTATEVGDSTVSKQATLGIHIVALDGVLARLFDAEGLNRTTRTKAANACLGSPNQLATAPAPAQCAGGTVAIDTDFDLSGLFHVVVRNPGDNLAQFKVDAFWDKSTAGTVDNGYCENGLGVSGIGLTGDPDGVPDGWRFNGPDALTTAFPTTDPPRGAGAYGKNGGFSGYYPINDTAKPLVIAAGKAKDLYFEVGSIAGSDACPNNSDQLAQAFSPKATLGVRVTNLADPSQVSTVQLKAVRVAPGVISGINQYAGAVHAVAVAPPVDVPTSITTKVGAPAVFDLVAVNRGNEFDDLVLSVDRAPAGWNHQLVQVGSAPLDTIVCDKPTDEGRIMRCPHAGVYDEVRFQVVATPTTAVPVGDVNDFQVAVHSGDASAVSDTLNLVATATGTYVSRAGALGSSNRDVQRGTSAALPFEVQNLGTNADEYRYSLLVSDPKWHPVFAGGSSAQVPAGYRSQNFLGVTAPTDATIGVPVEFRVLVESLGSGSKTSVPLFATPTAAGNLVLEGVPQDVLFAKRLVATNVTVKATQLSGSGSGITFTVDTSSLPAGWTLDKTSATGTLAPDSTGKPVASATFKVTAPANALASTKAVLHVTALTAHATPLAAATDVGLDLASTYGLSLDAKDVKEIIAPGGDAIFNLTLKNSGLGTDTVKLTNTVLPAGWTLLYNPPNPVLGPLQSKTIAATLSAPVTAKPGDIASLVAFATSEGDATKVASVALQAQVGFNAVRVVGPSKAAIGAPQETLAYVLNVTNNGTLPDQVRLGGSIDTTPLAKQAPFTPPAVTVYSLDPNQTIQVRVEQKLGDTIPSGSTIQSTVTFKSILDQRSPPASGSAVLVGKVLPYVSVDLNGDKIVEYAVDRNQNTADGFEEFRASTTPGGKPLSSPDLEHFLREDARLALTRDVTLANGTVVRAVVLTIDGDGDGKVDHFLDSDGDDIPDFYWDPDANKASPIEFRKDINGDQVPEIFVDTNGDGKLGAAYDLTRGTFTKVLQVDVDGDGQLDYVVDKNGNGVVDQDETVLYTRTGSLLIVQKVDVDGDGKLDQVFDTNGDGNPDYFIPNGSTAAVPIVLRDVNGDGTADWTFDGNNDGRRESYYDPVTGQSHVINAAGHFRDALVKYWYIGALFVVVLALFVALLLVTRR